MTTQWMKSSIDRKVFDELQLNAVIPEATDAIRWRVPSRIEVELRL